MTQHIQICALQGNEQHPCISCGKLTYHNFTYDCLCGDCMDLWSLNTN